MADQPKCKKFRLCTEEDESSTSNASSQDESVRSPSSSDSETSHEIDSNADSIDSEFNVNVEFSGCSIKDTDSYALQNFLDSLFLGCNFDTNDLAMLISSQANIGSVVISSGDDDNDDENYRDIFAFITALNMANGENVIDEIRVWCLNNCSDQEVSLKMNKILSSYSVYMLLCERFLDIPPAIGLNLYDTLMKDLKTENMKFDYYLLILKTFSANDRDAKGFEFAYPECELLFNKAELAYHVKMQDISSTSVNEMIQYCSVVMISTKEFETAINDMRAPYRI
ncbi:BRCA2 and CDKN1A-interacting protein [Trichoplax sp. H2]|uniref:BRCA2 and CDKN1A-interacting protein n=1 Tax=Trichoplax adhaerens TaxID=10228 RepID=B3SBW7_TRIAD|nr:hypothetical protein TRIADDRAFT_61762 [Trichoplax adhaerens]EDV19746.1 hypothetical protein TRIADDRAFT_61762 [Trichoplax adhaerens]RDD38590.1 BRCA2 and CDKN1A-interacting protein [Trichoplax sp. H2]|eukprot:XP_002117770.1 hypothetical protein TRIADDRAFT_61762 [Trichoplax adhaerens]